MRKACLALLLWTAALPVYGQNPQPKFSLVVPTLPNNGRLMGFDIDIKGGRVSTFSNVPAGWTISVNNDPSWNGSVIGQAVVGAAALDPQDLSKILTLASPPPAVESVPISVSGTITVMINGDERKQVFRSIAIRPVASPP